MEIRAVVPAAPAPSAPTVQTARLPGQPNPGTAPAAEVKRERQAETAVRPPEATEAPQMAKVRAVLHFDESINRIVGQIVNEQTGETVRELPPEELRSLYAKTREMLGPLVDETA